MDYGRALRTARVARGLTQKSLASLADVKPSYISMIENGLRIPAIGNLERFADALEMPLYLLILLGSEERELKGITKEEQEQLGSRLLKILVSAKSTVTN